MITEFHFMSSIGVLYAHRQQASIDLGLKARDSDPFPFQAFLTFRDGIESITLGVYPTALRDIHLFLYFAPTQRRSNGSLLRCVVPAEHRPVALSTFRYTGLRLSAVVIDKQFTVLAVALGLVLCG